MLELFNGNDEMKNLIEEKDFDFTEDYLKLPNGFMILYSSAYFSSGEEMVQVKYPIPFKKIYKSFAIHKYATEKYGYSSIGKSTLTDCEVYDKNLESGISKERTCVVVIIGTYK